MWLIMDKINIQAAIEKRVKKKLAPLFKRYKSDFDSLEAIIRWKPIVFIIGNYSSGKSTFINEILGSKIQHTGQSPTDDSFTIITSDKTGVGNIPGSTVVRDENLPFTKFKGFGKDFISHFSLKKVDVSLLEDVTIIDSPGMLDAVTEKDRGYNYLQVVDEFAKLADLVVFMFDSHKTATIKETYTVIHDVLSKSLKEDRIIFVMSRIDECDSLSDLVRSYGTLCWHLSQMKGRKDIPHIFLTYSPELNRQKLNVEEWQGEREELKKKVLSAPLFRINHILESIDRQVDELKMIADIMTKVADQSRSFFGKTIFSGFCAAAIVFALLYLGIIQFYELPQKYILIISSFGAVGIFFIAKVKFTRFLRQWKNIHIPSAIISLDTDYRRQIWEKVEERVQNELRSLRLWDILFSLHRRNLNSINQFIDKDLNEFYKQIQAVK